MQEFNGGQFRALRVLGAGMFGIVWLAADREGKQVAIKELKPRQENTK
jgi:serine/threonine protein kinase